MALFRHSRHMSQPAPISLNLGHRVPFAFWDTCTSHTNVIAYIFVISCLPGTLAGGRKKKHICQLPLFFKEVWVSGREGVSFDFAGHVFFVSCDGQWDVKPHVMDPIFSRRRDRRLGFQGTCKLSSQIFVVLTTLTSHK